MISGAMLFFALAFGCNTPLQDHHLLPATASSVSPIAPHPHTTDTAQLPSLELSFVQPKSCADDVMTICK